MASATIQPRFANDINKIWHTSTTIAPHAVLACTLLFVIAPLVRCLKSCDLSGALSFVWAPFKC